MAVRVLDTSNLITNWNRCAKSSLEGRTVDDAKRWAAQLIETHNTKAILTPVYLEMIAGVTHRLELDLTRAFLADFKIMDEGKITPQDWEEARRIAERIPRTSKRRQMGDCLIRAICNNHNWEVFPPVDQGFPG